MRAERHKHEERFVKASASHPCPICGECDWCGFNSYIASCMRVSEGAFKAVNLSNGQVAYLHRLEAGRVIMPTLWNDDPAVLAQTASIKRRDKVYSDFLSSLFLLTRHKEDLLRRGLTDWRIKKNGYRSVPEIEKPWIICKKLISIGHDLAGIPGFYKVEGPHGTYWTFDRKPGYFISVRDEKGRIQALQRRMDDTRGGKYMLFSGHKDKCGCSCGTPAHVAVPSEIKDERVWITEGPLKSDIASKYLSALVLGALSAGTWRPVIPAAKALGVREAVIAYDMDMDTKEDVYSAYVSLKAALKKQGIMVSQAVWEGVKGIDDALIKGLKINLREE